MSSNWKSAACRMAAAVTAMALASACSGGSGGANGVVPPTSPLSQAFRQAPDASAAVAFVVHVPAATHEGIRSIALTLKSVNGEPSKATPTVAAIAASARGCKPDHPGFVCTVTVAAPAGTDLFTAAAYRSKDANGRALAAATVSCDVTKGSKARIALDLDGVPASVSFSPARLPLVNTGGVQRVAVVLNAADASGATIVGASDYQSPVGLQIQNDGAHALTLSTSSVAHPGTIVTVTYDSSKPLADASIVATDTGMKPATLAAAPLKIVPSPLTMFDDALPAAITVSETGFDGKFRVSLGNPLDAAVSVTPGTLSSSSAVATVAPKTRFDVTTLDVSDGNALAAMPLSIVPHNGAYKAFGAQHVLVAPVAMVAGPDGKFWVSDPVAGNLVSFDPSSGAYTAYPVDPTLQGPLGIAFDANGNLWFADGPQIGEFTPQTSAITTYSSGLEPSANVTQIIAGPNGQMWFYDQGTFQPGVSGAPTYFGSIVPGGQISEHVVPSGAGPLLGPMSMVLAHDGSIWFADQFNAEVGHLDTVSGNVTEYATGTPAQPAQSPIQLLATPDGKIWFGADGLNGSTSVVGRLDPANGDAITYDTSVTSPGLFYSLILGSDGNLWFTQTRGAGNESEAQQTLGVINPVTGAVYDYPAAVPVDARETSLINGGSGTLWMLDTGFGQVGQVPFK